MGAPLGPLPAARFAVSGGGAGLPSRWPRRPGPHRPLCALRAAASPAGPAWPAAGLRGEEGAGGGAYAPAWVRGEAGLGCPCAGVRTCPCAGVRAHPCVGSVRRGGVGVSRCVQALSAGGVCRCWRRRCPCWCLGVCAAVGGVGVYAGERGVGPLRVPSAVRGVCTVSLAGSGVCPFVGLHPYVCPCLYVLAQVYLHVYPCTRVCQYTGVSAGECPCPRGSACPRVGSCVMHVPWCPCVPRHQRWMSMCPCVLTVPCGCHSAQVSLWGPASTSRGSLERFCCLHPSWRVSRPSHQQTGLSPQLSPPGAGGRSRDPLRSPPELMSLWSPCAARVFPSRAALQGTKRQ